MSASREKQLRQEQAASGYVDPKKVQEEANRKNEKRSSRLYAIIGVVFLLAVVASIVWRSNIIAKSATAVTIDGEKYTAAEVNFHYQNSYNNFINQYSYIVSYMGLNTAAPLKGQVMDENTASMMGVEAGTSWHDFFLDQAVQQMAAVKKSLKMAEDEGYVYPASVQAQYEDTIASIESAAAANGLSFKDYLKATYGSLMNEKVFKDQLLRTAQYSDYITTYRNSLSYDDAAIDAAYKADVNSFDRISYQSVSINGAAESTKDADGNTVEPTEAEKTAAKEAAKKAADQMLADYKSGKDLKTLADANEKATYSSNDEAAYFTTDLGLWLFDETRKDGDCTVIESGSFYYVAVFNDRFLREDPTVNVRHILFQTAAGEKAQGEEGYEEEQAQLKAEAKAKADALLNEWKAGAATEESFAELALANTEDGGSKYTGGLYPNVFMGQMVEEFEDWCFDASRRSGDTGVVETSYGAHVMYFVGEDVPFWQYEVISSLRNAEFSEWMGAMPAECEIVLSDFGAGFVG